MKIVKNKSRDFGHVCSECWCVNV